MRSLAPKFSPSIFFINDNILKLFRLIKYHHEHALMNIFRDAFEHINLNLQSFELICPVPLSKKSRKERGFNTAEEIARWISEKYNIPIEADGFLKIKETANQASLNKKQRQKNLKGAYQWNEKIKAPKSLLIVDDICTTGATFEECIKTAEKAEISYISTFSLFQTPLYLSHSLNRL
jgi:ComF family protein